MAQWETAARSDEGLFKRYKQTRDPTLREKLINEHLYIAQMLARRYNGHGVEYDDLFQVASIALLEALERYDPAQGVKFSTFALATATGVIKNYFRDKLRIIRLPRRTGDLLKQIDRAQEQLMHEKMLTPTPGDIAVHLNVSLEEVLSALETRNNLSVSSLDKAITEEGDTEISQLFGREEKGFEQVEMHDFLNRMLDTLSAPEQTIIKQRYFDGRTQSAIAKDMGVSQMYVSRIERRILERFRKAMTAQG